jgi:enterochelin esterase-like enzyme
MVESQFQTNLTNFPFEYLVYLPPCYQVQIDQHYPVIYLIHGQSFTKDQWPRLGVTELADLWIAEGKVQPFMMVFPQDQAWRQPSQDPFGLIVIEELIPTIDATYRTMKDREYRAVGGVSRGASWAVHLGLLYWQLFGSVGGHSLPIFWEDSYHVQDWLDSIPLEQMPRFFIDVGAKDDHEQIIKSATWFSKQLEVRNIAHEWHLLPGYHNETYWSGNLDLYLDFYTRAWKNYQN